MKSGLRHFRYLQTVHATSIYLQCWELLNKLQCLLHSKFWICQQCRYLLTNLKLGENHHFVPNLRSVYGMNSKLLLPCCRDVPLPAGTGPANTTWHAARFLCKKHLHKSSNITWKPGTWKCSAPFSNAAEDCSRIFPWLTAVWQHVVKHSGQMKALTTWRTTPAHHADKFQGYCPFISTTVYGQQLTWQSMPMRVSRDT